jgi:hypothetical protein
MDAYFKDLLKVLGLAAALATIPLIAAFAKLQPPWPPAIEYVSAVFIIACALVMWEWGRRARRSLRRSFIIAGLVLILGGIGTYLPLFSRYVALDPNSATSVVRGSVCTPDAEELYGRLCPDLPDEALLQAGWDAELLWTRASIESSRLWLVGAWLAFITGLIAMIGASVAGRPMTRTRAGKADGSRPADEGAPPSA